METQAPNLVVASAGKAAGPPARIGGLACPRCAGNVPLELGARVASCPFCHTTLLVVGSAGAQRLAVRARVSLEQGRDRLRSWLASGWNKDPTLKTETRHGEGFLCFLPFFRVSAEVVGQALGTERRTRTVGSGKNRRTEVYYVDVERQVAKSCATVVPAVNTAEWGVQRVDLHGDELVAFDSEELARAGMVFPPTVSAADAFAEALAGMVAANDPSAGLHETRLRYVATVREQLAVIYYPLWVLRYEHRGRVYQAVVDGEDGKLAYGKAPGNDLYRAAMLVGTEAVGCFVATTAAQFANELGPILGGFAIGGAIVFWGFKHFRWGGEIVEGTGVR